MNRKRMTKQGVFFSVIGLSLFVVMVWGGVSWPVIAFTSIVIVWAAWTDPIVWRKEDPK